MEYAYEISFDGRLLTLADSQTGESIAFPASLAPKILTAIGYVSIDKISSVSIGQVSGHVQIHKN